MRDTERLPVPGRGLALRRFSSAALAAVALSLACPSLVRAEEGEDAEITRMAKEHYKLGLDAFKAGQYPQAIKELKKAYLLKRLPPLLINIAKTYEKLNDVDNEIYYYKKYLAEAPPEARDRDNIKAALDAAEQRKKGGGNPDETQETPRAPAPVTEEPRRRRPAPPVEEPAPAEPAPAEPAAEEPPRRRRPVTPPPAEPAPAEPAPVAAPSGAMPSEWAHTVIDAVPPGQPVDVRVAMPVMKGVKVFLNYRGKGQAEFTTVEMKRHGSEKVARIPGSDVSGKSIQYYIEAKDKSGTVVKNSGSQSDPNVVMVDPDAPPQIVASFKPSRSDEAPTEAPEPASETPRAREREPVEAQPDEAPPLVHPKRNDDEEAPLGPGASGPDRSKPSDGSRKKGGYFSNISGLGIAGLSGLVVGVLMAAVGGPVAFYYAGQYSQAVQNDSCPNGQNCDKSKVPYYFNDPMVPGNDNLFQDHGHLADLMGIICVGAGAAIAIAGGTLVILDYIKHKPAAPPRRKRRPRPPVDAAPVDAPADAPPAGAPPAAAPPADAPAEPPSSSNQGLIHNFMAVPTPMPSGIGVTAAFTF